MLHHQHFGPWCPSVLCSSPPPVRRALSCGLAPDVQAALPAVAAELSVRLSASASKDQRVEGGCPSMWLVEGLAVDQKYELHTTHPSFIDGSMPPLQAKWVGRCDFNGHSVCNNKLINTRSFMPNPNATSDSTSNDWQASPVNDDWHGTHNANKATGAV